MNGAEHAQDAKLKLQDHLGAQALDPAAFPAEVKKSIAMHNQTIAACNSFHTLFCERHQEGKPADDHYEQDLLRAMLLFACSGLDAAVKQLVRDALESVISRDAGAQAEFAKYIERRLRRGGLDDGDRPQNSQASMDFNLLAAVLASPEPRVALVAALMRGLTADSLQSRDQLLKVASHFALTRDDVLAADKITKEAFGARNQLAHEMDIDFRAEDRRRDRSYGDMVRWSENILGVAGTFISQVAAKMTVPDEPALAQSDAEQLG